MATYEHLPLVAVKSGKRHRQRYTQEADKSKSHEVNTGKIKEEIVVQDSTNLQQNEQFKKLEEIECRHKVLMFILGVWILSDPPAVEGTCKRFKLFLRRSSPFVVIGILLLLSISILFVYLFCYNGKVSHELIFLSFVSYWVSVISPEIICTIAYFLNLWDDDIKEEDVHRRHIFNKGKILKEFGRKEKKFVFFVSFAMFPFLAKFSFSLVLGMEGCPRWFDVVWTLIDLLNTIFYTLFCYFMYLQRVALEAEGYKLFENVQAKKANLEECKKEVGLFFQSYKRLRDLLLPWISIVLLCSSCGLTTVFTWNYESVHLSPVSTPGPPQFTARVCSITCDKVSILIEKEGVRFLLNLTIFLRNITTAGFALSVSNGIDLKHVWDTFRQRFFTLYSDDNYSDEHKAVLAELIQFMDCMYTESTVSTSGIMISLAGLLIGIIGSDNFR